MPCARVRGTSTKGRWTTAIIESTGHGHDMARDTAQHSYKYIQHLQRNLGQTLQCVCATVGRPAEEDGGRGGGGSTTPTHPHILMKAIPLPHSQVTEDSTRSTMGAAGSSRSCRPASSRSLG